MSFDVSYHPWETLLEIGNSQHLTLCDRKCKYEVSPKIQVVLIREVKFSLLSTNHCNYKQAVCTCRQTMNYLIAQTTLNTSGVLLSEMLFDVLNLDMLTLDSVEHSRFSGTLFSHFVKLKHSGSFPLFIICIISLINQMKPLYFNPWKDCYTSYSSESH